VAKIPFSQRIGAKPIPLLVQRAEMNDALRHSLWNVIKVMYVNDEFARHHDRTDVAESALGSLLRSIWMSHYRRPVDELHWDLQRAEAQFRELFYESDWVEVYDLIEFLAQWGNANQNAKFIVFANLMFERELSAYRFVGGTLTEITGKVEIAAVTAALESEVFPRAAAHLRSALELMGQRPTPDARNSIKESISAVEAAARAILDDPKATLGKALDKLNKGKGLHDKLAEGFKHLYWYTSDSAGIRHAMSDAATVDVDDARYFVVSCSAFINYLKTKA
jgi:hypothetical protein